MKLPLVSLLTLGALLGLVVATAAVELSAVRVTDPLAEQWAELEAVEARREAAAREAKHLQNAREAIAHAAAAVSLANASASVSAPRQRTVLCLAEHIAESQRSNPEPIAFAEAILDAADTEPSVSAAVLAAVAWKESSYGAPHYMIGDAGAACGPWQQHPRWLFDREDRTRERVAWMCEWLIHDHDTAAVVAARQLASWPHICHYNQGNECDEGETYSAEVEAEAAIVSARCPGTASL